MSSKKLKNQVESKARVLTKSPNAPSKHKWFGRMLFIRPFVLWLQSLIKQNESTLRRPFFSPQKPSNCQRSLQSYNAQAKLEDDFNCCRSTPCSRRSNIDVMYTQKQSLLSTNIRRRFHVVKHLWCIARINCFHLLAFINTWERLYSILFLHSLSARPANNFPCDCGLKWTFYLEILPIFVSVQFISVFPSDRASSCLNELQEEVANYVNDRVAVESIKNGIQFLGNVIRRRSWRCKKLH